MAIQFRRGTDAEWKDNKNNIVAGEPVITLDTGKLFVGVGDSTSIQFNGLVEEGVHADEKGTWTYRKWKNGVLEQWFKSIDITIDNFKQWNSVYYAPALTNNHQGETSLKYHIPFVGTQPVKIITVTESSGGVWLTNQTSGQPLEWTGPIWLVSPAKAARTISLSIYAKGWWELPQEENANE